MKPKSWWIKERCNPQLGVYYVACGRISQAAARRMENAKYGSTLMRKFETEQAYNDQLDELRSQGECVQ